MGAGDGRRSILTASSGITASMVQATNLDRPAGGERLLLWLPTLAFPGRHLVQVRVDYAKALVDAFDDSVAPADRSAPRAEKFTDAIDRQRLGPPATRSRRTRHSDSCTLGVRGRQKRELPMTRLEVRVNRTESVLFIPVTSTVGR